MNILSIIIKTEYSQGIRKKSFMLSTLMVPLIICVVTFMRDYLDTSVQNNDTPTSSIVLDNSDISMAIISTSMMLLWIFILFYGAQIFNSVKFEKSNRIVEIILSSVSPTKFMLAKIIAVGLIGLTQIFIWIAFAIIFLIFVFIDSDISIASDMSSNYSTLSHDNLQYIIWGFFSFIGGYMFYGSLFAALGSIHGADNENQTYSTILMTTLILSMYATMSILETPDLWFADILTFLPLSSPIALSTRISQGIPAWHIILSYLILYASAGASLYISGKIYSAGILFKGKRITFSNIIAFIKS